jgi:hypothetical protein
VLELQVRLAILDLRVSLDQLDHQEPRARKDLEELLELLDHLDLRDPPEILDTRETMDQVDLRVSRVNRVPLDNEDNSVQLEQLAAPDCKELLGLPEHPAARVVLDTQDHPERLELLVQPDQREQRVRLDPPDSRDTPDHRATVDRWAGPAHLVGLELQVSRVLKETWDLSETRECRVQREQRE